MKKIIILLLLFSEVIPGKAQIKKISNPNQQLLNTPNKIKQAEMRLAPGKDLTIMIDSVADRSTSTRSDIDVYYSIVNSGIADVDIKNISIHSFINGVLAGASATAQPVFTGSPSILHSGQKWNDRTYSSGLGFYVTVMHLSDATQPLLVNHTYNYSLLVDGDNIVTETNENNNTASITLTGHYVPLSIDLAIDGLNVQYNSASKNYQVSCKIGNIGTTAIDLNKLAYWDCVNKDSYTGYGAPIVLGYMMQANCGQSVCGFSLRLDIHGNSNIISPGQVITATGIAYGYHGACGGPLKFTYILDPDNKTGDQNLNNNTVIVSVNP